MIRWLTMIGLATILAVCGIVLTPIEAVSRLAGFFPGGGGSGSSNPFITSIVPTPLNGTLTSGSVSFAVNFSTAVTIAGGTPTLALNAVPTPSTGTCATASNVTTMTCTWSIGTNQSANPLGTAAVNALQLNGATIQASSVNADLTGANNYLFGGLIINPAGTPSVVTGVAISPSSGLLITGSTPIVAVTFSTPQSVVTSPGNPSITLTNGTVCPYASGSTTSTLNFGCTILAGQDTPIAANSVASVALSIGANTYLGTAASGAIQLNGGQIANGGVPATLNGANGALFSGVSVNTSPFLAVAASGGGGSTCSLVSLCTFAGGISKAAGGGVKTVYMRAGTYSFAATTTFTTSNSGLALLTYPGDTVTWSVTANAAILIDTASNFTFNGFHCTGFRLACIQGQATSNGGSFVIMSNVTCANGGVGFQTNGAHCLFLTTYSTFGIGSTIAQNNSCATLTGACININPATGTGFTGPILVDRNNIFDTVLNAGNDPPGAIYIFDLPANGTFNTCGRTVAGVPVTCVISNNIINNTGQRNGWTAGRGIYLDGAVSGFQVFNNSVSGLMQTAIQIHGGGLNVFSNNFLDLSSGTNGNGDIAAMLYQDCGTSSCGPPANPNGMAGNTMTRSVIYSTAAPPSRTNIWCEQNNTITPPAISGNKYYSPLGTFPNSSSGFGFACNNTNGPMVDTSPTNGNPGLVSPANPANDNYQLTSGPSGWVNLLPPSQIGAH